MCVSEYSDIVHSNFFIYARGSAFRISMCEFPVNYFSKRTNQNMFVAAHRHV